MNNIRPGSEERAFRDKVRTWLADNAPRENRPLDGPEMLAFDKAWQKTQYEAGWAGISWPREFGGCGLSLVEQMIWHEEYARAGAPSIDGLFVGLSHAGPTLIAEGSEEQKRAHLQRILAADEVWCQGFSEPNAGSDLAGITTHAKVDGDHLVVNGSKIWTSFAHVADYQELLLRTEPGSSRHKGLTWVICDMKAPGITIRPIMSMAAYHQLNQVFYDDVRIPLANTVGGLGNGWRVAMTTLRFERGTAMLEMQVQLARKVEALSHHARETAGPDGRPLIHNDAVAESVAVLRAEVAALRAMAHANVARIEREGTVGDRHTIVALYYGELVRKISRAAFELSGDAALEIERRHDNPTWFYLASFPRTISGGSSQIRRNIIGERVLGLPR
jgi:alkylation response protein AidB-like acyl-CoA dehydrogenase